MGIMVLQSPILVLSLLFTVVAVEGVRAAHASPREQAIAAEAVIARVFGNTVRDVTAIYVDFSMRKPGFGPGNATIDTYSLLCVSGGVLNINASSGAAAVAAAYQYFKNYTGAIVTWGNNGTGDNVDIPSPLPATPLITGEFVVSWRYAWNMCTFGYSATWWGLERWQREIDWMALHGVNMPLALIGQEYIWMKVFQQLGVSLAQLEEWFTGPAFLPWQRAGNIRGWAGPLGRDYITQQAVMQKQILQQMRALGMVPVLPCFGGHVPKALKTVYPNANMTHSTGWNSFPENETDVWYLDPTDPLYTELGSRFTKTLIQEFGTDHFYSCDTFNEVNPTSTSHSYLKEASAAVLSAVRDVDPTGVWVMQAWLFHFGFWYPDRVQAYLSGVPKDGLLILDLNSEVGALAPRFEQYYGKYWVWNMLHNYGGRRGVYGNLSRIATGPMADLQAPGSTMCGIGYTPEAIEQNPVMYEMLTSTFWTSNPINVTDWLLGYVHQRYDLSSSPADWPSTWQAWSLLRQATYNQNGDPVSEIELVPSWENPNFGHKHGDATAFFHAWEAYLNGASEVPQPHVNGPWQYDLVDIGRQSTAMFFSDVHRMLANVLYAQMESPSTWNASSIASLSAALIDLIEGIDSLLGTNPNYLLGTWLFDAATLAGNGDISKAPPERLNNFLMNAKNQITMWGPDAQIDDYACKPWNALYKTYYAARWKLFLEQVATQGPNNWDHWQYQTNCMALEKAWNFQGNDAYDHKTFPNTTNDVDPISFSWQLMGKTRVANVTDGYTVRKNSYLLGADYTFTPLWTTDVRQLARLCDLTPSCVGFQSDGYLKTAASPVRSISGVDFYIKKSSK